MKILLIIPAYNEEKNLPSVLTSLKQNCPQCDILVVDDCSNDGTRKVCKNVNVNVVSLPVNLGIGGAVQTGYKYANYFGYDIAIQVDGDGQHNSEYINELIVKISDGVDLCIGSRFIEKQGFQSTALRRVGINYFSKLIKILSKKLITDPTSGFRACNRKVIECFAKEYPTDYPEPETVVFICKKDFSICEIPVIMNDRAEGKSSITKIKSIYYLIKVSIAIIIASISSNRGVKHE